MRIADLWFNFKFCFAKERVHTETARRTIDVLARAANIIDAHFREHGQEGDNELSDACRRLASQLFATYGPERRGARIFVLAKKRARLHAIVDAASNIRVAVISDLDDDRDLA